MLTEKRQGFVSVYALDPKRIWPDNVLPNRTWPMLIGETKNPWQTFASFQRLYWFSLELYSLVWTIDRTSAVRLKERVERNLREQGFTRTEEGEALTAHWYAFWVDRAKLEIRYAADMEGIEIFSEEARQARVEAEIERVLGR